MFQNLMGEWYDYLILIIYFIGILGFGAYFAKFTKSTEDFFFGGQRFSWWLIAASLVATGIGSYSFLKYAQTGFMAGLSSTMSYLNDWLIIPLFMFGWLPVIYFMRIKSVPEFFERRFDKRTRRIATVFVLLYLLGYIGLNFYLMGLALQTLLGIHMWVGILIVAAISAVYVTTGGQTAVIFTDLIQGLFLYIAGGILLYLAISHVGGFGNWWQGMDLAHRLPFPGFNSPAEYSYSGMFWGEGIIGSMAFTFMNQGFIMRYLAVKSVNEGRKTLVFNTLILMPLSAIVVGSVGWLAVAMATTGEITTNINPKEVFMFIANIIARPGIFGFVVAALTAALMSTIDTLINAVAAIGVFDVYKPLIKPKADDKHYLKASRFVSVLAVIIGLGLVQVFSQARSILAAHYAFVAMITPPMLITILLGLLWKRFTPKAAFWSMILGGFMILVTVFYPQIIIPLSNSHGVSDGTETSIVFERYDLNDMITGPRSAYNWGEMFDKSKGELSEYTIEYHPITQNTFGTFIKKKFDVEEYSQKAPVYMYDTSFVAKKEGRTRVMHRYCANLEGLEPRAEYKFRVAREMDSIAYVEDSTGAIDTIEVAYTKYFDAIGHYGTDEEKYPIDVLGEADKLEKGKIRELEFETGGDYKYFRAVFGLLACLLVALIITPLTKPRKDIDGYTLSTIFKAKEIFKGGKPNEVYGEDLKRLKLRVADSDEEVVRLSPSNMEKLKARVGDLLYVADSRKILGGLRSVHVKLGEPQGAKDDEIIMTKAVIEEGNFLDNKPVNVEKIM
ncbi:MAG: sodium:solute symporter [Candidatus Zixiibacteriota bacterium]